jgi:hypothetical protein
MIGYSFEWCQAHGLPGYDAWKTRLPDWWDGPEEEEGPCVCGNSGWLAMWVDDDCNPDAEIIIPCTECSSEFTEYDMDVIDYDLEGVVLTPGAAPGSSVPQTDALAGMLSQEEMVAHAGAAPA